MTSNHFPKIPKGRNERTMGNKIGVPVAQGLDVPNFFKDVPNFFKDVLNFVKNVPRLPKFVLRWGMTSNHFLMDSKGRNEP